MPLDVQRLARKYTLPAIRMFAREMAQGDTSAARIAAGNALMDRAWGKPAQSVIAHHSGEITDGHDDLRVRALAAIEAAFSAIPLIENVKTPAEGERDE